jgi:hypothetical protein
LLRDQSSGICGRRRLVGIVGGVLGLCRRGAGARDKGDDEAPNRLSELLEVLVEAVIGHFAVVGAGVTRRWQPLELVLAVIVAMVLATRREGRQAPLVRDQSRYLA